MNAGTRARDEHGRASAAKGESVLAHRKGRTPLGRERDARRDLDGDVDQGLVLRVPVGGAPESLVSVAPRPKSDARETRKQSEPAHLAPHWSRKLPKLSLGWSATAPCGKTGEQSSSARRDPRDAVEAGRAHVDQAKLQTRRVPQSASSQYFRVKGEEECVSRTMPFWQWDGTPQK